MQVLYEKNANELIVPASITKVLTALTVLDLVTDLNLCITINSNDCVIGSGASFIPGDQLSVLDALYALLLPSSNVIANALARTFGKLTTD